MPSKKDISAADSGIAGYDLKETKLLAAAFVSSVGADKYDYALFAKLTGFTEGTLKKFWPPVKKKVIERHESFGSFLSGSSAAVAAASKAFGGKKRKTNAADTDAELESKSGLTDTTDAKAFDGKKKTPAKGKRSKKVKTEEVEEEAEAEMEASSAGGEDVVHEA